MESEISRDQFKDLEKARFGLLKDSYALEMTKEKIEQNKTQILVKNFLRIFPIYFLKRIFY